MAMKIVRVIRLGLTGINCVGKWSHSGARVELVFIKSMISCIVRNYSNTLEGSEDDYVVDLHTYMRVVGTL